LVAVIDRQRARALASPLNHEPPAAHAGVLFTSAPRDEEPAAPPPRPRRRDDRRPADSRELGPLPPHVARRGRMIDDPVAWANQAAIGGIPATDVANAVRDAIEAVIVGATADGYALRADHVERARTLAAAAVIFAGFPCPDTRSSGACEDAALIEIIDAALPVGWTHEAVLALDVGDPDCVAEAVAPCILRLVLRYAEPLFRKRWPGVGEWLEAEAREEREACEASP
jgi:hypothetical protein